MNHRLLTAAASLFAFAASNVHAAELTEQRVNELIETFLRENPNVMIESLQQFQLKEEANRIKKQSEEVKKILPHFERKNLHYGEAGNPDGDVLIVEFFDYNCPACKMMFESIDALLLEDPNVRVVFVEFPIFGEVSDRNAVIALALNAIAPDKYYTFHQALMRHKGKMDESFLLETAARIGVDKEKLEKEAAKEKYAKYIEQDRAIAQKLQISGTPAIIVGEKMANGALDAQGLKNHVRWARDGEDEPAAPNAQYSR